MTVLAPSGTRPARGASRPVPLPESRAAGVPGVLEVLSGRPPFMAVAGALTLLGSGVLLPRVGPNGALVDPVVALGVVVGAFVLKSFPVTPAAAGARAVLPPILLIAIGTTLSLYGAGLQSWALLSMAQSAYAFATFIGLYAVFWQWREHLPLFSLGAAAGILLVTVSLVLTYSPGVRPAGVLYHPNYAGHYLVAMALCVHAAMPWRRLKVAVLGVALCGVFLTASFGALVMIGVSTSYLLLRYLRTRPGVVAFGLAGLVVVGAVGYAFIRTSLETGQTVGATSTLNSARLQRSGSGRLYIWQQALAAAWHHPLGVGPDGLHNRGIITRFREAHNLYVAFVAERGLIGLLGLLLVGVLLWRHAPAGGMARASLLAFAAANMVRETFHYRHMWLALALVLVADHARRLDELGEQRETIAERLRDKVSTGRRDL